MSEEEYKKIRDLVYRSFGINLTDQKRALIVGRLNKVLRELDFSTFSEYYDYVTGDQSGKALSTLVDRISTNHTFFWRESDHFEYFSDVTMPEIIKRAEQHRDFDLRIWIAGCSSGEESYLVSMLIREALGSQIGRWKVGVLATDISVPALEKAMRGVYTAENVAHLPAGLRNRYMRKLSDGSFEVLDEIKRMVTHRRLNLMRTDLPFKKTFQCVFCRNVMIYFDRPTRDALVERMHKYMDPDSYLFIGHSETLGRNNSLFEYVKPALYRRIA
jgi:chemotaxis protein methyltransferase CheR